MVERFWSSRRFLLAVLILSSCIGCDQATKTLASQSLKNTHGQSLFSGIVRLEYALNPGGFLSLGSNLPERFRPWFFVACNVGFMLAIGGFLFMNRRIEGKLFIALSYILAGGIGNLIDRISNNGQVTDFINVGIGPLRTGIFNVADMAVMFGGLAVVALTCREPREQPACPLKQAVERDAKDE